jgi:hypothetical protein
MMVPMREEGHAEMKRADPQAECCGGRRSRRN